MNAIAIVPGTKTVRLVDRPEPTIVAPDDIKLKALRLGICGTDREEAAGGRAKAPLGHQDLVLGHEMFGQVDHVPCPTANIHPMPTRLSAPDAAAGDYEATLRSYFSGAPPAFDVVLLGLGPEGHTASLFPGSPVLPEPTRWVLAVTAPVDPPVRLTLTFPALTRAANIYFLVTGANKARALHHILTGTADPNMFPAAGVRLAAGRVIWWVDREAAAQHVDPDLHNGAIEGDHPDDEQQGNANVPALDECGLPAKLTASAEDRIGATVDDSEVANADETGQTTGASRDEVRPLD